MKNYSIANKVVVLLVQLFSVVAFAKNPHLSPFLVGEQYLQLMERHQTREAQHILSDIVDMGARNLDWLKAINAARPDGQKLSFTNPDNQPFTPIDKARKYNPTTIRADYNDVMNRIPDSMKPVLLGQQPVSAQLPMAVDDYLKWAFEANRVYEAAARWISLEPYLEDMAQGASTDVRGYYFLSKDENREQNFANFDTLSSDLQAQYKEWLVELCTNHNTDRDACASELATAVQNKGLSAFYQKYVNDGKQTWDAFFTIPDGIKTPAAANDPTGLITTVTFKDPQIEDVRQYLKVNIEDEWHWDNWALKVAFAAENTVTNLIELIWQPGVVPHVEELGGNAIVMDQNAPLTEYDVQWTIRHEFGHIIGFPDCYLEYYDKGEQIMVYYQLDTTNLMCSRRGHLKQTHYDEMKRVYSVGKAQ